MWLWANVCCMLVTGSGRCVTEVSWPKSLCGVTGGFSVSISFPKVVAMVVHCSFIVKPFSSCVCVPAFWTFVANPWMFQWAWAVRSLAFAGFDKDVVYEWLQFRCIWRERAVFCWVSERMKMSGWYCRVDRVCDCGYLMMVWGCGEKCLIVAVIVDF